MADTRIYLTAVGYIVATLAYAYAGWNLRRPGTTGLSRVASGGLQLWWYGLSLGAATYAIRNVAGLLGFAQMPLHLTLLQSLVIANAAALAGLVTYLLYLFMGHDEWLRPVVLVYFSYYVFYTFLLFYTDPVALVVGPVRTSFEYAGAGANELVLLFVMLFYVPQVGAATAYAMLWPRAKDKESRYRIALVSASILIWSLSNMGLIAADGAGMPNLEFLLQNLGLVTPLGVLLAYHPPSMLRRRFISGVTS